MTIIDETLNAVDQKWRDVAAIHARVDCWARTTIRGRLLALATSGKVEMREVPAQSFTKHEFRLPQ